MTEVAIGPTESLCPATRLQAAAAQNAGPVLPESLLLSKQVRELNFYEKSSNFKCKQLIKNILKIPHKSKGTCSLPRFSQWPRRLQPLKGIYRRIIIMILFKKSVSSKSLPMQGKYYGMWTWSTFFQLILVTHGDKGRLSVRTL